MTSRIKQNTTRWSTPSVSTDQIASEGRLTSEDKEILDIQKLLRMGFDESDVMKAYYQASRDVRRAAHKLVDLLPKSSLESNANAEDLEMLDVQRLIG